MESLTVTPNLTMLRVNGWQVYVWREGESATLIDSGARGSGAGIAKAVSGIGRELPIYERVSAGLPIAAPPVPVDRELRDGDVLDFGGGAHVLAIPGHTEGSVAVHLPEYGVPFTGDTIANVGSVMLGTFNQDRAYRRVVPATGGSRRRDGVLGPRRTDRCRRG